VPRTTTPAGRRAGRILVGLAALAGLLALVVAVPLLLLAAWHYLGPPVPSLRQLSGPDDGTLFVRVLCLVGWLGWVTFTWSLLAEILVQWRGWRLPAFAWQRRMAAGLVASIVMMLHSPAIASATASPVHTGPAQARPAVVAPLSPAAPAVVTPVRQPTYLTHEVQRGEQMPQLAQHYYGDRFGWQKIAAANYGITQPDGRVLRPGDTRIYPGWQLRIPVTLAARTATANPAAVAPTATTAATQQVYQVRHGDWLWYIADRFLGDPQRYPEIAALNPGLVTATSGIHGPDHIEAGWHLTLPTDAHDRGPRTHAAGTVVTPSTDPGQAGPSGDPAGGNADGTGGQPPNTGGSAPANPGASTPASPPASATPGSTASPTTAPSSAAPSASTTAAPSTAATPAPAAADRTPSPGGTHRADSSDDSVVYGGLAGASLLAALLLGAVLRRRRRQRQHRRPQRRLPHPRGGATETALRIVEQPADVDRLDTALRALAAGLAEHEQADLPDILGAWIVGGTVHVILSRSCPYVPAGWVDEGQQWTLPASIALPDVDGQVAPLPTLVAVGSRPGRHLMLDLERLSSLSVGGDPDRARNLLRYIASELACNSWSDDVEVVLAGFGQDESELLVALNPDRVRAVSSVPEAVARLRRRVVTATGTLRHVGARDALAGRIGDLAGDAWMPQVLLVADPDERDLAALGPLADDLAAAGRCAVAVAATGTMLGTPRPEAVRLTVAADGVLRVTLGPLDTSASAAGLPADELEPLAEIMRQARTAADEPVPPAAETEPWAADTDAAGGLLGLFGRDVAAGPAAQPQDQHEDEPASTVQPASGPPAPVMSIDPWLAEHTEPPAQEQPEQLAADGAGGTAIPAVALTGSRRQVTAAIRQRRRQADPHLDRDLKAWHEQDPGTVRVSILGPVTVAAPGEQPTERQRFLAEIIVFLAQRAARGATADKLTDALWPDGNVKDASRRVAITRARRWLGTTPAGEPWLPDMGADRTYRLADGFILDWHLFRRLRSRGEAHGPAGVKDLRAALDLIRGAPLDGADRAYAVGARNPYTWLPESDIYPGHVVSAVVDTAHELAELYLEAGDTTNARWAVQQAWLADPYRGDDQLWRDIMRAEYVDGHGAELRQLLGELIQARDAEVPEDLSRDTYAWLRSIMPELLGATSGTPS